MDKRKFGHCEESMESSNSYNTKDRRRYPRVFIDLPLEYREMHKLRLWGGIAVNASETGLLIESIKDIPIGTKLNIAVLFPRESELADFKAVTEILWKEHYRNEDWEGCQYGLKFIQLLEEDRWKLNLLISDPFHLEKISYNG
jgi:hypothetical protein